MRTKKGADGNYRSNANIRLSHVGTIPVHTHLDLTECKIHNETQIPSRVNAHLLVEKTPVKNRNCEVCNSSSSLLTRRRIRLERLTDQSGRKFHPQYLEERRVFSEIIGELWKLFHHGKVVCESCG